MACNSVSGGDCGVDGVSAAVSISRRRGRLVKDAPRADDTGQPLSRIVRDSHGELQIGLDWITRSSLIGDKPKKTKAASKPPFYLGELFSRLKHVNDDEQPQPDHVHKVPIPRSRLEREMMLVIKVAAH